MSDKTPERLALEARAKDLKVKFSSKIGDDTLKERVEAAEAEAKTSSPTQEQPPETQTQAQAPEKTGTARLEVTGPKGGFWRAGMQFTDVPRVFEEGDLTEDQLDALNNEPQLKLKLIPTDDE